jgi:putative N6-adenine-specific DNA methylase
VDASGENLHKRGYRQEISRAPLRETLAAGLLALAGYTGDAPLVDPMCGSGTLPIEAAWIAQRRAPGLLRHFAFEAWPSFDPNAYALRRAALEAKARPSTPPIVARDLNAGSLGTARRNARRAGVQDRLTLERVDALTAGPPLGTPPGLVVVNPPYGKRVGEGGELTNLYAGLGRAFRERFAGWRAAVLVPDRALEAALALEPAQVHPVDNGGIACRLVVWGPS